MVTTFQNIHGLYQIVKGFHMVAGVGVITKTYRIHTRFFTFRWQSNSISTKNFSVVLGILTLKFGKDFQQYSLTILQKLKKSTVIQ